MDEHFGSRDERLLSKFATIPFVSFRSFAEIVSFDICQGDFAPTRSFVSSTSMAAGTHMAATQQAADDQASSLYFSGICQTISVKCQHRNENGLLTCSRNLYVSCTFVFPLLPLDVRSFVQVHIVIFYFVLITFTNTKIC